MKTAGYILLTLGFLAGALASVETSANQVSLGYFVPPFLLAVVGVVLARVAMRRESHGEGATTANIQTLHDSINTIAEKITRLDAEKESIDVYDLHARIDELFADDLTTFVGARKTIGHQYSLQAYADVMNCFAAAERYLNRVWCCSVDGYIDEAHTYIGRSREQFIEARAKLESLRNQAA